VIRKSGKLEQQISDFMDGELDQESGDRIIDLSKQNPASHKTWQRYHLIGDAIRHQLPETLDIDLSQRIRQSLEKEPTIFAPDSANTVLVPVIDTQQAVATVAHGQRSAYKVGLAMAATVAFAAVFGLQMMPVSQPETAGIPLAVVSDKKPAGVSVVSAPLSHPMEFDAPSPARVNSFASLGEWKRLEQSPLLRSPETSPYLISNNGQIQIYAPGSSQAANNGARVVGFGETAR